MRHNSFIHRSLSTALGLVPSALVVLTGCGSAPFERGDVDAETSPEAIYAVRGTVTEGERMPIALTEDQEVGVLWLNAEADGTVLAEVTPTDVIGSDLPASFDVSVITPPSDALLGTTLVSYTEGGSTEEIVDRSRVGFGVVVVAPAGALSALPASASFSEFIGTSDAQPGSLLRELTYVSPYTVRYVKGASDEGLVFRDINGVESVLEDMTMFDVRAWAAATDYAVCRDQTIGSWWDEPEVVACIDGSTDGNVGNECLYAYVTAHTAELEEGCGLQPDVVESDFRNSPQVAPGESITLPIGDHDIGPALTVGGFIFLG
jgi:hypothetical protein